jgi:SAM-dependent methyltransferase
LRLHEQLPDCTIASVTIERTQADQASTRFKELDSARISSVCADAIHFLDKKIAPESIDAIIALDCAYHFRPHRGAFFASSARALRSGGSLGLVDIVFSNAVVENLRKSGMMRLGSLFGRSLLALVSVPEINVITAEEYRRQLEAAGFSSVLIDSIESRHVFGGLGRFASLRVEDARRAGLELGPVERLKMTIIAATMGWIVSRGWCESILVCATK